MSPNNILVTSHLEAKITDLGVAKVVMTTGGDDNRWYQGTDKNSRN